MRVRGNSFLILTFIPVLALCVSTHADSVFGDPGPLNTNAETDVELDSVPSIASDGAFKIQAGK